MSFHDLPKVCLQTTRDGRKCIRIRGHRGRHRHAGTAQLDADNYGFALRLIAWGAKHDMPARLIRAMANSALRGGIERAEAIAAAYRDTRTTGGPN